MTEFEKDQKMIKIAKMLWVTAALTWGMVLVVYVVC